MIPMTAAAFTSYAFHHDSLLKMNPAQYLKILPRLRVSPRRRVWETTVIVRATASFAKQLAVICLLALFVADARAAVISWSGATNITSDANIVTNGDFEYGGYFSSSAGTVTINGVTFTGSAGSKNFGANVTANFASGGTAYSGMGAGTGLSTNYQTLLGGCAYGSTNNNSIALNNLAIGYRYTVQLWINDSRSNGANSSNTVTSGNSVTLDYNNSEAVGGKGQFAIGTFTADATTLTFNLQSKQSGQFNALQLRSQPLLTNISVSVNATQSIRIVDRRLFSLNTAIYDGSLQGESTIPLLFELGNQGLRWPGGSYGDSYLLSTEAARPSWQPRTTNFLYAAKSTGADSFVIANYGTGTTNDAVALLRHCNITNQAACKYWEIGNEIPGTWENDNTAPPFTTTDILDLSSLANKLYAPTNNISTYLRSTLSSNTLSILTNYISAPATYDASLRSALVSEINDLDNNISPSSIYKTDPNRFLGVAFRAVTLTNLSLPIPNAGQDLNNRMTIEDAYPTELAKITPAINLASNWPDVYLPHDPWTYAQRFAQFYSAMKAVDPTIKIGAVGDTSESGNANGYTHHFGVNLRTGTTNYAWMPVMLSTLRSLGVTPDFVIYHNYPGNGDAQLLQWSQRLVTDAASMRQLCSDYSGPPGTNTELAITEVGEAGDKSSTSIVGGLFYADNTGQALLSGFSTRLWFGFRIDEITLAANTNAYGWRDVHAYSVVRGAGATPFDRYPSFYTFKLMQYFARGGDTVVTVTNISPLLTTYAVKRTNGTLTLLVINKSPTLNLTGNFDLTGYTADLNATAYSFGIPQDEMVRTNGSGLTDIAVTNFTIMSPSAFSYNFAPYSATVISLSPPPLPVIKQYQSRITFTNYLRSEVLTNFPVLVVLKTNLPGLNYGTFASSSGGDLRFKSGDGATELNYEIESWNPGGNSYVWVQVPRFTNNCSILAQWGGFNGRTVPAYTTNGATWSNGFIGVWHLDELFGAHNDSSTNQGVARYTQAVGQGFPVGISGGGDNFNDLNASSDYVSLPNMGTNAQVTVECWTRLNAVPPDTLRGLVSCDQYITGITHFRCNNSLQVQAANFNGTTLTSPANSISVSNWFYSGYVMAGAGSGNFRLFLNGTNVATGTGASPSDNSDMNIAREYGGRYLNSRIDEVRISSVARSTNWLWVTYQNIASNSIFNSVSAVTSVGVLGTNITAMLLGNSLRLDWSADHTGWRLQVQTNSPSQGLGNNWFDVSNATATNQITVPMSATNGAVFYRMIYP